VHKYSILYDEPQEANWFRGLHPRLHNADERSITSARGIESVERVLAYDRPDIILMSEGIPVLVLEETVEVPSGHNVGQRFARIAAAAEAGVPSVYFGPYVARKHGGKTAGPRFMNVRLFHALGVMQRATGSAVTTINWPVDEHCEVRRDPDKDTDVRQYMHAFFRIFERSHDLQSINRSLIQSQIHERMIKERNAFVENCIRNSNQYDNPPDSVAILGQDDFQRRYGMQPPADADELVLYNIGMASIRSDPYTGMAILYRYLYLAEFPKRKLVLWFPHITLQAWRNAAAKPGRKDVRLFRIAADAILFKDALVDRIHL